MTKGRGGDRRFQGHPRPRGFIASTVGNAPIPLPGTCALIGKDARVVTEKEKEEEKIVHPSVGDCRKCKV